MSSTAPDPASVSGRRPQSPEELLRRVPLCMTADQRRLRQRLAGVQRAVRGDRGDRGAPQGMSTTLLKIEQDIARSQSRRASRAATLPRPVFPPELPISEKRQLIKEAMASHQVVVVCGETGSGKSTQLPKICLELGRGSAGVIGHTQPRRIAARSVAQRVADELGTRLGDAVGVKVRFGDSTGPGTHIKVMTDGILLAEVQSDPLLEQYDTIIIDEAHERSLNIDFLMGYLKQLLPRRPDLKLIITSATIDPDRFSKHFDDAPIVLVSGRTYPVEMRHRPVTAQNEDDLEDNVEHAIVTAVAELAHDSDGDILVFLASEREIRETMELLDEAGWGKHAEIVPLFARLSAAEQMRVFQPGKKRRIVLATNVAETSITVPGVRGVIDCGFARMSRYSAKTKVQRLPIEPISQASADQRAGRCGRVGPGICIRLYAEEDYQQRPKYTSPEIMRTNLAAVVLRMKALRLGEPASFPFVEPPDERSISDAYDTLRQLQAMDEKNELTPTGVLMARLPVEPAISRIILAARENELLAAGRRHEVRQPNWRGASARHDGRETRAMVGALEEVLIIVAAMSVMDPRERPLDLQQKADVLHNRFRDELSDFVSYLKLWWYYKDQAARLSSSRLRKLCKSEFLSFVRLREWDEVHRQLVEMISELPGGSVGLSGGRGGQGGREAPGQSDERRRHARRDQLIGQQQSDRRQLHGQAKQAPVTPLYEAIHRALLTGLIASVGKKAENFEYDGPRTGKFQIFPGSGLFKARPEWIVAGEIVRTTKMYARTVARVKPEWIEQAGEHLLKRTYFEPHYDEQGARVMAYERVSLLGLMLVEKRRVSFERADPAQCREIFIHNALVEFLLPTRGEFQEHNRLLVLNARKLQDKLRRSDLLADPSRRFAFFEARVPRSVLNGAHFEKWRFAAERDDPRLLFMKESDVVALPEGVDIERDFPDVIDFGAATLELRYHYQPGADHDGVTAVIPVDVLPTLDERPGQWLVPGMRAEKFEALIRSLPKRLRVAFSPAAPVARELASRVFDPRRPILDALAHELSVMAKVDIFASDFNAAELPPYLFLNHVVVDRDGKPMLQGRDLSALRFTLNQRMSRALSELREHTWNRDGLTNWTFDDIPERVEVTLRESNVWAFPALYPSVDGTASLRLFVSRPEAAHAHRRGQVRLFMLAIKEELRKYLHSIKGFSQLSLLHSPLGTQEQLRTAIAERACELTFVRDEAIVRSGEEFRRRLKPAEPWIDDQIKVTAELVAEILTERQRVAVALSTLTQAWAAGIREDALRQLGGLIHEDFLVSTPLRWFTQYSRYLRALDRRLQRVRTQGATSAEKDARIVADARRRADEAAEMKRQMSPDDPRWDKLIDYRWQLEEYRVVLFAQDLAITPVVSPGRLDAMWVELNSLKHG